MTATTQTDATLVIDLPRALREPEYLSELSDELEGYSSSDAMIDAAAALDDRDAVIADLVEALNDSLLQPKGSIPHSADKFYDGKLGRFTVAKAQKVNKP